MAVSEHVRERLEQLFPAGEGGAFMALEETDPEFFERFAEFAFGEVPDMPLLECEERMDERTRFMGILAVLLGCQGCDAFREMAGAALQAGVTPVEIREIVYQAAAYLGFGRVFPFFKALQEVFRERNIALPLEAQGTNTKETRRETGTQCQVEIFGDGMRDFWKSGPEETRHINTWLAANCFGDYYTRKGLDLRQREMVTFCFILAQGGCESQLLSHAKGNMHMGNDRRFLIRLVSQCLPFIGYPRTLNAIAVINKAAEQA